MEPTILTYMKKKSIVYKTIGGGLLLFSFIIQNFLYDYWDQKSSEYISAHENFSAMNRSSLLYLNLYFNTELKDDSTELVIKQQYIQEAAKKIAFGKVVEVSVRDTTKKYKTELLQPIMNMANEVHDFDSYDAFIKFINITDTYKPNKAVETLEKYSTMRNYSRWAFLALYIIGSFILLKGIKFE